KVICVRDCKGVGRGGRRPLPSCIAAVAAAILGSAFVGLPALQATAAEQKMPLKVPAASGATVSWTQAYVGFGFGFDAESGRSAVAPLGGGPGAAIDGLQGVDLGLTATAGFDVQVAPRFVLGGFADYDWSRQKTTIAVSVPG